MAHDFSAILSDPIVGDFIPMEIHDGMTLPELHALETIFYLRLQLAQVTWEDNEPLWEELCRDRYRRITEVLTARYTTADTLGEKIEILTRLETIAQTLNLGHNPLAVSERQHLLAIPSLTFPQRYRLQNLLDPDYTTVRADIDRLLEAAAPTAYRAVGVPEDGAPTPFSAVVALEILLEIDSLGTPAQYAAVTTLLAQTLSSIAAPPAPPSEKAAPAAPPAVSGSVLSPMGLRVGAPLLVAIATANSDPARREIIKAATAALTPPGVPAPAPLPEPVRRVNAIAAQIYTLLAQTLLIPA